MSNSKLQLANSPLDAFVEYFLDAKPYHTKLLEIIETYRINESMIVKMKESVLKEITIINDPLCKLVGFGVNYDDNCGYDALSCCDLFDCVPAGYGFVFDNSDLLVSEQVEAVNTQDNFVTIRGNYTADKRIPITEIPSNDTVTVKGDKTAVFQKHKIFLVTDVQQFTVKNNTDNTISIEGDHYNFFKNRNKFHIIGTDTPYNKTYYYYELEYDPITDMTNFSLSYPISTETSSNLIEDSLQGLPISVKNSNNPNTINYSNPNLGIFQVTGVSYDSGNDKTTITVNAPHTQFNVLSSELTQYQLGSIQIREGLKFPRFLSLNETGNSNQNDHKILFSIYDHSTNTTALHLSGDISAYNETGLMVEFFGYFFDSGFDPNEECSTPKDTNIHTGLQERLQIFYDPCTKIECTPPT